MFAFPDSCGNGCGLIAAFIGVIGFGCFGAPFKSEAANSVNPDAFVLQTYKSTMCFLTSFIVLGLGVEYKFSPYGLLSGLFWVTGGACGIFGIRNSGLAISVGTWSSITVLVSFAWGILVFGERVKSVWTTTAGVCMMIIGFIGMSYFSSPEVIMLEQGNDEDDEVIQLRQQQLEELNDLQVGITAGRDVPLLQDYAKDEERQLGENYTEQGSKTEIESSGQTLPSTDDDDSDLASQNGNYNNYEQNTVLFLGMKWNRRRLGLLGAVMDGIFGGMMLVPMQFSQYKGEEYIISFGTGAMTITLVFWAIRLAYNAYKEKSLKKGYERLPSLHFKKLIIPGCVAGVVWSIGNIGLIFSVSFLGESIGMSIVQSNMIVSGMIGIIWFEEIKGTKLIIFWTLSAILTFIGIVFLSYQHKA